MEWHYWDAFQCDGSWCPGYSFGEDVKCTVRKMRVSLLLIFSLMLYRFVIGFGRVFQGYRLSDASQKKIRMAYCNSCEPRYRSKSQYLWIISPHGQANTTFLKSRDRDLFLRNLFASHPFSVRILRNSTKSLKRSPLMQLEHHNFLRPPQALIIRPSSRSEFRGIETCKLNGAASHIETVWQLGDKCHIPWQLRPL